MERKMGLFTNPKNFNEETRRIIVSKLDGLNVQKAGSEGQNLSTMCRAIKDILARPMQSSSKTLVDTDNRILKIIDDINLDLANGQGGVALVRMKTLQREANRRISDSAPLSGDLYSVEDATDMYIQHLHNDFKAKQKELDELIIRARVTNDVTMNSRIQVAQNKLNSAGAILNIALQDQQRGVLIDCMKKQENAMINALTNPATNAEALNAAMEKYNQTFSQMSTLNMATDAAQNMLNQNTGNLNVGLGSTTNYATSYEQNGFVQQNAMPNGQNTNYNSMGGLGNSYYQPPQVNAAKNTPKKKININEIKKSIEDLETAANGFNDLINKENEKANQASVKLNELIAKRKAMPANARSGIDGQIECLIADKNSAIKTATIYSSKRGEVLSKLELMRKRYATELNDKIDNILGVENFQDIAMDVKAGIEKTNNARDEILSANAVADSVNPEVNGFLEGLDTNVVESEDDKYDNFIDHSVDYLTKKY